MTTKHGKKAQSDAPPRRKPTGRAVFFAVLAALLYALSTPFSKMLLRHMHEVILAGLLYLGAGILMAVVILLQKHSGKASREVPLGKGERKYVVAMVLLDILAPIFLLLGLSRTTASNASLLNNFEIVATSLFAFLVFKERFSRTLMAGLLLVVIATVLLTIPQEGSLSFSGGSLLVLCACVCWGLENNCTRMISSKDARQIVVIKGFGSGLGSLLIGFVMGFGLPGLRLTLAALVLGMFAFGLSVYLYVLAQRRLGAAKTSAFYAIAPFLGVVLSVILLKEMPGFLFFAALSIMLLGVFLTNKG